MYVGHFAAALAARAAAPEIPLWAFCLASFAPDLVEAGIELVGRSSREVLDPVPAHWQPSAVVIAGMAIVVMFLFWWWRRDRRAALAAGLACLSHAVGDFIGSTQSWWPGGERVGFGLVHTPGWAFTVEVLLVLVGWLAYRRSLPPSGRASWACWSIPVLLAACQALSILWQVHYG